MNSKKNNTSSGDDDLKFIPLNLKEQFKPKDSSCVPCINMGTPTNNMTNNFFMGLPDLQSTKGFTVLPNMNGDQLPPYSSNFSSSSPFGSNNPNINLNTSSNMQPSNMQSDSSNNFNPNNIVDKNELYPSEYSEDELYSYNTDNNNNNNNNNRYTENLLHLDILRDYDLSLDSDITTDTRGYSNNTIEKIFTDIEDNNNGLLATLKSYRMPYPIATLVIKKIIKVTLDNSNKE